MIRHSAAVAVSLCLSASMLHAQSTQDTTFVVSAESASVYKSPSTGAPVIGHAQQGAVLPVSRELGSWVKVSWPAGQDGVGYLHVTTGWISHGPIAEGKRGSAPAQRPAPPSPSLTPIPPTPVMRPALPQPQTTAQSANGTPVTHLFGLGATIGGSTFGYGASARAWQRNHVGVQLSFSHDRFTSATAPGQVASTQIQPSVLYALSNRVSDYLWVRPYVGSGVTLFQQTLSGVTPGTTSDHGLGWQAFGGTEASFAAMPQFALSADVGYQRWRTAFAGFDPSGISLSLSAHWYVR